MPTKVIASSLGLIGFVVAILAGLAVNNPATTTLWRALCAMVICYTVGSIIGAIAMHAISEQIEQYKASNPLPVEEPAQAGDVIIEDDEQPDARTASGSDASTTGAAAPGHANAPREGVAA